MGFPLEWRLCQSELPHFLPKYLESLRAPMPSFALNSVQFVILVVNCYNIRYQSILLESSFLLLPYSFYPSPFYSLLQRRMFSLLHLGSNSRSLLFLEPT